MKKSMHAKFHDMKTTDSTCAHPALAYDIGSAAQTDSDFTGSFCATAATCGQA